MAKEKGKPQEVVQTKDVKDAEETERAASITVRISGKAEALLSQLAAMRGQRSIAELLDSPDLVNYFGVMLAALMKRRLDDLPKPPGPSGPK